MDSTKSPEKVGFSFSRLHRIDGLMQGYIDRGDLAGISAVIARHGQTVYREKFGWMNLESRNPIEFDTIFQIASMTKAITSVAAMMLYEEGFFHLNTPLSKFIPELKERNVFVQKTESGLKLEKANTELTFRHLFTHTSGFCYGFNENDPVDVLYANIRQKLDALGRPPTSQDILDNLLELPLAFQPGTHWRYGMNLEVLGILIEKISGMRLDEFMQERIFNPLQMVDTAYYVPAEKRNRVSTIYAHLKPNQPLQKMDEYPMDHPTLYCPGGGGLVSTLDDYSRFTQMLVNGGELNGVRLLSPRTVAMYSQNYAPDQSLPYGFVQNDLYHAGYGFSLGTRVLVDPSKTGMYGTVGEFGWDGAFSTYFWVDPKESLYGLLMLQHYPNAYFPIAQQFKSLTYQSILD